MAKWNNSNEQLKSNGVISFQISIEFIHKILNKIQAIFILLCFNLCRPNDIDTKNKEEEEEVFFDLLIFAQH